MLYRQKKGAKGVWGYLTDLSEGTSFEWPVAKVGNVVKRAEEGFKKVFVSSQENIRDVIANTTDVLHW